MTKIRLTGNMLVAVLVFLGGSVLAQAQQNASFVSGVGSDANPCTRSAPCATFAFALTQTNVGGTLVALDNGQYGPVTITQSVTIDGGAHFAGIQLTAAGTAITLNIPSVTTANTKVVLRRLTLDGGNGAGTTGIGFAAGTGIASVSVLDCRINNFSATGIDFEPSSGGGNKFVLSVDNTTIRGSASGIIVGTDNGDLARAQVYRSRILDVTSNGIQVLRQTDVMVRDTAIEGNASNAGNGINAASQTAGQLASITLDHSAISRFNNGILAGGSAGISVANVSGSDITDCLTGFNTGAGGSIVSFSNNTMAQNSADGSPTSTKALK